MFSPTIREFSKSQYGQDFLRGYFDFSKLPRPDPSPAVEFKSRLDSGVLGSAFDQFLQLLIERQNPAVDTGKNTWQRLADRRSSDARHIRAYLKEGTFSDPLLDFFVRSAHDRHKSFSLEKIRGRPASSPALRDALRSLHDIAARIEWSAKNQILRDWFLVASTAIPAKADLILDGTLFEIKTTKDFSHHAEHVAQLFAYFLVSQLPVRKHQELEIGSLAVYYARHGTIVKSSISNLILIRSDHVARAAFDFLVEFELWVHFRGAPGSTVSKTQVFRDAIFNRTLRHIHPRPAWLSTALEAHPSFPSFSLPLSARTRVSRIKVPDDFLRTQPNPLDTCESTGRVGLR
jgi:hypothetical protein